MKFREFPNKSQIFHLSPTFQGQGCVFNNLCLGLKLIQLEVTNVLLLDNQISQTTRNEELKEEDKPCFAQILDRLGRWLVSIN